MKSKQKSNIIILFITALFTFFILGFINADFYIIFSFTATFYFFLQLISNIGNKIPLKEATLFITCLQYLLSPALDYEYLGRYIYFFKMQIPPERYYVYAIPAVLAIWIGLMLPLSKNKLDESKCLKSLKNANPSGNFKIGIILIIVGYGFFILQKVVSIQSLNFVFTLFSMCRFVGLIYVWLSAHKYSRIIASVILIEIFVNSVRESIFVNLIVMFALFYCYYNLLYKVKPRTTFLLIIAGISVIFLMQSVKSQYRSSIKRDVNTRGASTLTDMMFKRASSLAGEQFLKSAAAVNLRVNQGWVQSGIMKTIPSRRPFMKGEVFLQEVAGLVLPRVLMANKAVAQSSEKFERFAGYKLRGYTVAVGILGDGYGNFGIEGGIVFCFFVGLFFNIAILIFLNTCRKYPSLLPWYFLIFFYIIRAGDDFYIIANWIIKSSLFVAFIFMGFRKYFKLPSTNSLAPGTELKYI